MRSRGRGQHVDETSAPGASFDDSATRPRALEDARRQLAASETTSDRRLDPRLHLSEAHAQTRAASTTALPVNGTPT